MRVDGLDSGQTVRRRQFAEPGFQMIVEDFTYSRLGRFRAKIRAEGGFGPGCGTARKRNLHRAEGHRHTFVATLIEIIEHDTVSRFETAALAVPSAAG